MLMRLYRDLAGELARLRRLMREPRRADLEEAMTL